MRYHPYRVLFLAANPSQTSRLRLDREVREVEESLQRSHFRDQFRLFQKHAVRMDDLRRALLDVKPHILHFSGHGAGEEGLVLDDDQSGYVMVESTLLTNLIQLSTQIKCVVLNACHSQVQAAAIAHHIPYAIGMDREIGDQAAIQFATAFYDAIFAGEPIPKAYQYGVATTKAEPIIQHLRNIATTPESAVSAAPTTIPILIVGQVEDPTGGVFELIETNPEAFGFIQFGFGLSGQQATEQGILHIQAQSLTGCVINTMAQGAPTDSGNGQSPPPLMPPQSRPHPIQLAPKAFPQLVGRKDAIEVATLTLPYHQPVEFYGPAGIGKTALLRYLAHHPAIAPLFSGGLIYHRIRQYQSASDLLQVLFNAVYVTESPYKPSNAEIRQLLQHQDILALLDGSELSREQLDSLIAELPDFTFLLTSLNRQLWGEGRSVSLGGLAPEAAVMLVSREMGRSLTPPEQQATTQLCTALQGHPLRILQAAALAQEPQQDLVAVAQKFQTTPNETSQNQHLLAGLQKPHLLILSLLAAMAGAALAEEQIAHITHIPQIHTYLEVLLRRHLIVLEDGRYRLSSTFMEYLGQAAGLAAWKTAIVTYFARWAPAQNAPAALLDNSEALYQALQWAIESSQWPQAITLGQSLESSFALSGQWDAWGKSLEWLLQAAQAANDPVVSAYALHQLGSRSLGLNHLSEAQSYLQQALDLRTELGDRAGIAATQQNLEVLRHLALPPQPSLPDGEPPSPSPATPVPSTPAPWPWIILGIGILGAVTVGLIRLWPPNEGQIPASQVQLTELSLSSPIVQGGKSVEGRVVLNGPVDAPLTIQLSNSNSQTVTVEPVIQIDAGESGETFTITTRAVTQETPVEITALYGDRRLSATLTVSPEPPPPVQLKALRLDPAAVVGGDPATGTLELTQAPAQDVTIQLQSSNAEIAALPATITVSAGETVSAPFEISTAAVTEPASLTITAQFGSEQPPLTAALTVNPPPTPASIQLSDLTLDPNPVIGGTLVTGVIALAAAAPQAVTVQLSSTNSAMARPADDTVTIPAGATSASFPIETTSIEGTVELDILAMYDGQEVRRSLTINPVGSTDPEPPQPCAGGAVSASLLAERITLSLPESVEGGQQVSGRIQLNDCVPPEGGITLTLASDSDYLAQSLTSQVTFTGEQREQSFSFVTPSDLANYPDGAPVTIVLSFEQQPIQQTTTVISPPVSEPF